MLQRGEYAIYQHYQVTLLPILLGNIYGTFNMHWDDNFFMYIIDQKVESLSDVNWAFVLKEKPFLTRKQISTTLDHARIRIPSGRSSPKWIEERKLKVNQIYDDMMKAKSK